MAADRYNRKRLLIITDLMRGVTVLGFLLVRNPGDIWLVYVLTALQMGMSGFFFPTRNAILPDITTEGRTGHCQRLERLHVVNHAGFRRGAGRASLPARGASIPRS